MCAFFISIANAQLEKGNVMVGSNISNLNLGLNTSNDVSFRLTPKAGWFIDNGLVLGTQALFGITHVGGTSGSTIEYGIGGFGRYFALDESMDFIRNTKIFFEAGVGFQGRSRTSGASSSTNGVGFAFGPGISYFFTSNVGVEALLQYNGIVGFGAETYQNILILNIGFQIYLPFHSNKTTDKVFD